MSMWAWVLAASLVAWGTKMAGYLVPRTWLDSPGFTKISGALTIGLLVALVTTNTFAAGKTLSIDSRVIALLVAAILLRCKVPFLLVVILGAASAGLARSAGLP